MINKLSKNFSNVTLKNIFLVFFLVILILIAFYRSPYIFTNGRFLTLELKYYLEIKNLNFFDSLFFVDLTAQYINMISNISSLIASRFLDMQHAQFASVYLSITIYFLIIYYILFKDSYLFKSDYSKLLCSLIIFLSPIMNFEIWLNAINLQVYLGILTVIIFFLKDNKNINIFRLIILTISGLSGVYSCALTPIFLYKFYKLKNIYNGACALILGLCALTQTYLIYKTWFIVEGSANTSLTLIFTKYEAISYLYNVIIRPFFGSSLPTMVLGFLNLDLYIVLTNTIITNYMFLITIFLFCILLFISLAFIKSINEKKDLYVVYNLIVLFLIFSFLVIFGGVSDSIHGRYSTLPGFVLVIFVLFFTSTNTKKIIKYFSIFLIFSTLFFGSIDYRYKKFIYYLDCLGCPDWKEEVRKYNNDKNYNLKVWPYHLN